MSTGRQVEQAVAGGGRELAQESGPATGRPEEETGQRLGSGMGLVSLRKQLGVARNEVGRSAGQLKVESLCPQSGEKGVRWCVITCPLHSVCTPIGQIPPHPRGRPQGFGALCPEAGGGNLWAQRRWGQPGPGRSYSDPASRRGWRGCMFADRGVIGLGQLLQSWAFGRCIHFLVRT